MERNLKVFLAVLVLSAGLVKADPPTQRKASTSLDKIQENINSEIQSSRTKETKAAQAVDSARDFNMKYGPVVSRLQDIVDVLKGPGQQLKGTREARVKANQKIEKAAMQALNELLRMEGIDPATKKKLEEMKRDPKIRNLTDLKEIIRAVSQGLESKDFSKRHAEKVIAKANEVMGIIDELEKAGADPMRADLPGVDKKGKVVFQPKDVASKLNTFNAISAQASKNIQLQKQRQRALGKVRAYQMICPSKDALFREKLQLEKKTKDITSNIRDLEIELAEYTDPEARQQAIAGIISKASAPALDAQKLIDNYNKQKQAYIKARENIINTMQMEMGVEGKKLDIFSIIAVDREEWKRKKFKIKKGKRTVELDVEGIETELLEAMATDLLEKAELGKDIKKSEHTQALIKQLHGHNIDVRVTLPNTEPMKKVVKDSRRTALNWYIMSDKVSLPYSGGLKLMTRLMDDARGKVKVRDEKIAKEVGAYKAGEGKARSKMAELRQQRVDTRNKLAQVSSCYRTVSPAEFRAESLKSNATVEQLNHAAQAYKEAGDSAARQGYKNRARRLRDGAVSGSKAAAEWIKNKWPAKAPEKK